MNMKFPRRSWHLWRLQGVSLVYECTDPRYFGRYEIDLREITSSAKMLDLIFQIAAGKVWATNECVAGLIAALNEIFDPQANLCPSGRRDQRLTAGEIERMVRGFENDHH